MRIGYARTSTTEQIAGLEAQLRDLAATGCTKVFHEQVSSVGVRPELKTALDWVRSGDTFVVTRIDRLARSTSDLLQIISRLEAKGVGLVVKDFGGSEVDTQSATGRLTLTVLSAIAEFERSLMLARQREGIERAKAEGRYQGRVPTARAKLPAMRELAAQGVRPSEIARRVGVSRASAYRLLAEIAGE